MVCECNDCDGEGEAKVEKDCPCSGCFEGEHEVETDCGSIMYAPCDYCNGKSSIMVKDECEICNGSGINHKWKKVGMQKTFSGKVVAVNLCSSCGKQEFGET